MHGIGNTQLVRLERLPGPDSAEIWLKIESANPTGSMKDRMALSIIEGAEARGDLKPGGSIVDYTGGSTGGSLAMVCAAKGYRALFVSSDAFSESKMRTIRAFGGEVEIVPSVNKMITRELMAQCLGRVKEILTTSDAFWTDQFDNPDNRGGYHGMAHEILVSLGGAPDEFITGVGTGGSFSGTAEVLRPLGTRCIAIEPANSRALSGVGPLGGHRLEGMGAGFIPGGCRMDLADEIMQVTDDDAYATARRLAREEGMFGGTTTGSNVWAALQRARELGPGKRIVTILCDSGLKYLEGSLFA